MLFSVLALLVVGAIVMKLAATQLQAIKPAADAAVGGPAGGSASAANPGRRAAELIDKAVQQGAAMRAADAASR